MAEVEAVTDRAVMPRPADPEPAETPPIEPSTPSPATGEMSLVDHLVELRNRIIKSIIAIGLGSAVGFVFWERIRDVLLDPLPSRIVDGVVVPGSVQVLGPGDAFAIALRISIVTGIILAMPVLLWQIWAFVAPGLTDSEKRSVRPWIPLGMAFFALGVGVAYLVLPAAVGFLLGFTDQRLVANLAAGPYFDFVTTIFLAFGLVLEFPIVLFGLSRVSIVTSGMLVRSRRIALLGIAVFAAGITPGGDIVSPLALGGTMYALYEGTIFFIRRSGK